MTATLSRASVRDTARILALVLAPTVGRGVIIRREAVLPLAGRLDVDQRACAVLAEVRERYGPGPLRLRAPLLDVAVVLDPDDVGRLLTETPETFTAAERLKRGALTHFEPTGVLVSGRDRRALRRPFNERVLDTSLPVHHLHDRFAQVVREEVDTLLAAQEVDAGGALTLRWPPFHATFNRIVRRVVLGDAAADDERLTEVLDELRAQANWSFFRPRSPGRLRELAEGLKAYVRAAEPGSLAAVVAATPAPPGTAPVGQIPQWLFAFDAAGIAVYRALALAASHPDLARRLRAEAAADGGVLPLARGTVLESVRLWPTTLTILRESLRPTQWSGRTAATGTSFLVVSSFFHRDETRLEHADRCEPEIWLDGRADTSWSLVPFSGGPAGCPGRNLVLAVTSTLLSAVVGGLDARAEGPVRLDPAHPLPRTLDHTSVTLRLRPATAATGGPAAASARFGPDAGRR
ncbi:cytochrome P450 [Georgenia wangjunii]|uniref:cytochrome P450 n=1 Tax=Georgenia wangjunii TaxID=3117730 RepID=UPI002F26AF76